jgi:tetratricopeptide (TPR) repeat protein
MLAATGEVKLIDFGIAKATMVDDSLTKRGVVGKADWTAPELFHGAKLDRRADLFGLGLLYWYILTHRDPADTQSKHAGTSGKLLPVSAFTLLSSPELDRVVARAMDANPDFRFQSAADLQKAASQFIPEGFDGKAEVANLIFRNTSRLADGLYARLLEQGRPLLDDAPAVVAPELVERRRTVDRDATEIMKPRDWRRILLFVLGGVVLGVAVLVVVSRGGKDVEVPAVRPVTEPEPVADPMPEPAIGNRPASPDPATGTRPPEPDPATGTRPPAPKPVPPVAKAAPTPQSPQPSADELLASAKESFEESDLPKALALARRAAEQGAGAPAFVLIGSCLSLKKDFAGAQKALKQALLISPGHAEAKRMLERLRNGVPDDTPP